MGEYDVGQTVKLTVTVTDPNTSAVFDPSTVLFKVLSPLGVVTLPTVTRQATGVYWVTVVLTAKGTWWWRVETTGPNGAAETDLTVRTTHFP